MNKKFIVAALGVAFAAPVFADASNVTLYGRIHQAIEHNTTEVNGTNGAGSTANIADYSSRLGVRGTEDLGGGLSAIFAYEFAVDSDALGGITGNRHAYLGFKGSFGTVVIGSQDGGNDSQAPLYNQAQAYLLNVNNNAGQLTVVGGNDAAIVRNQRVSNAIGYATTVAGVKVSSRLALQGADQAAGSTAATETDNRELSVAGDYTIGALTFGAGYSRVDGTQNDAALIAATALKSNTQLVAKYNFGSFQLGGLLGRISYYNGRTSDSEFGISGLVPLNSNSGLQALYSQAENGQSNGRDVDNTQFQVSAYYDFSKRTRSYVGFNRTTRESFSVAGANTETDDDSFVVGLRHNF